MSAHYWQSVVGLRTRLIKDGVVLQFIVQFNFEDSFFLINFQPLSHFREKKWNTNCQTEWADEPYISGTFVFVL